MKLSQAFDVMRSRIPLKGRDTAKGDAIRAGHRVRSGTVGRRAPRRDSFRVYWRTEGGRYPPDTGSRRDRRHRARLDWREEKGETVND